MDSARRIADAVQVVTVNHVPQDYEAFAVEAEAVGSLDQLIGAIERGVPPASDVDTGVMATEVLMAAYRSIVEGRTVDLPLESGENPLCVRT